MTILIEHNNVALFDIEYYLVSNEKNDTWYSELHCLPRCRGISYFLKDNLNKEGFDLGEFIKDSEEIQELRGWLWEKHNNNWADLETCRERHYHKFKPELDEIIRKYCEKYGLFIHID